MDHISRYWNNPIGTSKVDVMASLKDLLELFNPKLFDQQYIPPPIIAELLDLQFDPRYNSYEGTYKVSEEEERQAYDEGPRAPSRKGQAAFRRRLFERYFPDGVPRCMVSGYAPKQIIEAAHIKPYAQAKDHNNGNGLLLRVDIHRLYDKWFLGFKPIVKGRNIRYRIVLHPEFIRDMQEFLEHSDSEGRNFAESYLALDSKTPHFLDFGPTNRRPLEKRMRSRWDEFNNRVKIYNKQNLRRNPSTECSPIIEEIEGVDEKDGSLQVGVQITTERACYRLLGHHKSQHVYNPSSFNREVCHPGEGLARPLYSYVFPVEALENKNEMFGVFRKLFMGDECLLPFLDPSQKVLSQKQMEAICGNGLLPEDVREGFTADPGYWSGFIQDYVTSKPGRRGLLILPTGMGKTVIGAYCYRWLYKHWEGKRPPRLLFIAHRTLLLDSAEETFLSINPELSKHTAQISSKATAHIKGRTAQKPEKLIKGSKLKSPLALNIQKMVNDSKSIHAVFITRTTLANWVNEGFIADSNYFDFVIIDEAHHATEPDIADLKVGPSLKKLKRLCEKRELDPKLTTDDISNETGIDRDKVILYCRALKSKKQYELILSALLEPRYLLGMTATEYANSAKTFDNNIIYRISGPGGRDLLDAIRDGFLSRIEYREVVDIPEKKVAKLAKTTKARKTKKTLDELSLQLQVILEQLKYWSGVPSSLEQLNAWQHIKDKSYYDGEASTSDGVRNALAAFEDRGGDFETYDKTLIYCQSQEHCMQVAMYLKKAGVRSFPLISDHTKQRQKAWRSLSGVPLSSKQSVIMKMFNSASCSESYPCIDVLCVKSIADEGVDIPSISTIIFAVATKSFITLIQRIGRGLRLSPGKREVNIVDLVSNYTTWKDYIDHGMKNKMLDLRSRKRFSNICKNCGYKNRTKNEFCERCEADITIQVQDTDLGAHPAYTLEMRKLDDARNTLKDFPTALEAPIKKWVRLEGLAHYKIVERIQQEVVNLIEGRNSELDSVAEIINGRLVFDDHDRDYDPKNFIKLLDVVPQTIHTAGVLAVTRILQPNLLSPTLAEVADLAKEDGTYGEFFHRDKRGEYYDHTRMSGRKCNAKTYDLSRAGCAKEDCPVGIDTWSMCTAFPEKLKAKINCLKQRLEYKNRYVLKAVKAVGPAPLRYYCGLIGEEYDQKIREFLFQYDDSLVDEFFPPKPKKFYRQRRQRQNPTFGRSIKRRNRRSKRLRRR